MPWNFEELPSVCLPRGKLGATPKDGGCPFQVWQVEKASPGLSRAVAAGLEWTESAQPHILSYSHVAHTYCHTRMCVFIHAHLGE